MTFTLAQKAVQQKLEMVVNLTIAQQAVVDATDPYLIVSATAGAGKSKVLVERIKRLIRDGTDPARIAAISFTNSASAVLQERLGDVKLGWNTTLHGWLLGLLTQHGSLIGLYPPLSVIDEEEEKALLSDALDEVAYRGSIKAVEAEVDKGPGPRLNPMTACQIAAESFFYRLKSDGIFTFDMIEHFGFRLLRKNPGVVNADYLFLDEAQDCTDLEWRILDAAQVPHFMAIGDSDQRIYSWRGSSNEFEKRCVMAISNDQSQELRDNH